MGLLLELRRSGVEGPSHIGLREDEMGIVIRAWITWVNGDTKGLGNVGGNE